MWTDNVRFWCMFGVVAMHCDWIASLPPSQGQLFQLAANLPFRFSTIGFFLVSGFLLEKDLATRSTTFILRKRLLKVGIPWLVWAALFILLHSAVDSMTHRSPFQNGASVFTNLQSEAVECLTNSAFWFIPNLMLSLVTLLVFRKFLRSAAFGAVLLGASLFYAADSYFLWFNPVHTRAVFGYMFYLWLGQYAASQIGKFHELIGRIRWLQLLTALSILAAASMAEMILLTHRHAEDPMSSLRISNQLFAVAAVLCLAKFRSPKWPPFVNVGRHTFGIYLLHPFVISLTFLVFSHAVRMRVFKSLEHHGLFRLGTWLLGAAFTWTGSYLISSQLAKRPTLSWLVGLASPQTSRSKSRDRVAPAVMSESLLD